MIVVRVTGGLGNQMFQYAFARALQLQGKDVYLHWHPHKRKSQHMGWALDKCFEEPLSFRVPMLDRTFSGRVVSFLMRKLHRVRQGDDIGYQQHWQTLDKVYLDGYWQSPFYFQQHQQKIRRDFLFRRVSGKRNLALLAKIQERPSISVHVRCGDYVGHPELGAVCGAGYYAASLRRIRDQFPGASLLVFSDDLPSAMKLVGDPEARGVDWNLGDDAWMDMALMSQCSGHVIANSTFSWWGAWLADGSSMTIAPKNWFSPGANVVNDDIRPKGWLAV